MGLVFLVVSCQDIDKMEKPDKLIPEDKMIDILTELSLVQAARNYNKSKLEDMGITPDTYIYEKFGIDSLQFEKSTEWYAENYLQYDRMYDSVKARIESMKKRIDSTMQREQRISDSIKLARRDSIRKLDSMGINTDSLKVLDSIENSRDALREGKRNGLIKDSLLPPSVSASRDSIL